VSEVERVGFTKPALFFILQLIKKDFFTDERQMNSRVFPICQLVGCLCRFIRWLYIFAISLSVFAAFISLFLQFLFLPLAHPNG